MDSKELDRLILAFYQVEEVLDTSMEEILQCLVNQLISEEEYNMILTRHRAWRKYDDKQ